MNTCFVKNMTNNYTIICFLWYLVCFKTAFSKIKSDDFETKTSLSNELTKWDDSVVIRNYDEMHNELIKKVLQIVKHERRVVSIVEIKKCLSKYNKNINKKLNCIKRLVSKGTFIRDNNKVNDQNDIKDNDIKHMQDDFLAFTPPDPEMRAVDNIASFSKDYLDVGDILRTDNKMDTVKVKVPLMKTKTRNRYVYKLTPIKNKYDRFAFDLTKFRKFGYNENFIKNKILRTLSGESGESDSSEESSPEVIRKGKDKKPKRFQVVDKTEESNDNSNSDDDIPMQRPIPLPEKEKPVVLYMQAPTRILKVRKESRRRLPYFFPKRYHWDEDDIKDLMNYWFSGPQGKYGGHYKTPY